MRHHSGYIRLAFVIEGLLVLLLMLENDNHVFKWVEEAFTDEIQHLDHQV
ncbi:hypothetical protein YC2023_024554 [Brassica napus]